MPIFRRSPRFEHARQVLTVRAEDDREAVVFTAQRRGRTHHLVVIASPGRTVPYTTMPADILADLFAGLWGEEAGKGARRSYTTDGEALILVEQPDDEGQYRSLPYVLPDPPDPQVLAGNALADTGEPVTARGPYQVPWTPAVAFVVSGQLAGQSQRFALVTGDRSHWVVTDDDPGALRRLFHDVMAAPESTGGLSRLVEHPVPAVPWTFVPEPLASASSPADLTPAELGRSVLTATTLHRHAGLTYRWLGPDGDGGHAVQYRRDDDEPWTFATLDAWPPNDFVVERFAAAWDALQHMHADRYLRDAVQLAQDDQLEEAFHQFALHTRITRPDAADDARYTLAGAMVVGQLLYEGEHPDLAEWVATSAASLAERFAEHDMRRRLLRLAAMACESLAQRAEALLHYEQALAIDEPFGDPVLERDLNLDFVTTTVRLMGDHEPEGLFRQDLEPGMAALLRKAARRLDRAAELVVAEPAERSGWARLAVAVYRWRLRDLAGEHGAAAAGLADLLANPALDEHGPLRQSAVLFRLMALCKLADQDPDWEDRYAEALTGPETKSLGGDRACVYLALRADQLAGQGDDYKAFANALLAHRIQLVTDRQRIRQPRPGERHTGWLAIDALARLHRLSLLITTREGDTPDTRLTGRIRVLVTESAKGRWFRRDLNRGLRTEPDGSLVYSPVRSADEGLDERLTWKADLPAPQDEVTAGRTARRRLDSEPLLPPEARSPTGLKDLHVFAEAFPDFDLTALRSRLPEGTALLSFYAARDLSHVVCMTPHRSVSLQIEVPLDGLTRAAVSLQAAFSGTGLHGRIDPDRPFDVDDRLYAPFRDLGWWLHELVPFVRDAPLIMIAPHAAWHNIPVHALLLPELWETGRNPALTYVPSIGVAEDMLRRAAERPAAIAAAAVAAVPARAAEAELFADCRERITAALRSSSVRVDEPSARDATPDEVMSILAKTDLAHVLAHGWYRDNAEAMDSGLALSRTKTDDGQLSGRDLLGGAMAAAHVTFQACSLGRVVVSASDDQWGPARAALLAGADSVLAPMWDVDLRSSTELIARFYESYLKGGVTKARAFTEAQRSVYQSGDAWRHPYHWAAFKLTGV
ncbi:CHAT domain-containing protein [Actinomadura sp. KC216]|uniref:CHAT domain-containing protein n=1 Tax=Actinomadura sp. KC216 TaxID=2530370 RepID=UPI0010441206|nr:CHAT domain-containing protein [Actinomadura sp. KC216]TDB89127.1 CHAT domain-containing protein [Actinomadura sp. KC216]